MAFGVEEPSLQDVEVFEKNVKFLLQKPLPTLYNCSLFARGLLW